MYIHIYIYIVRETLRGKFQICTYIHVSETVRGNRRMSQNMPTLCQDGCGMFWHCRDHRYMNMKTYENHLFCWVEKFWPFYETVSVGANMGSVRESVGIQLVLGWFSKRKPRSFFTEHVWLITMRNSTQSRGYPICTSGEPIYIYIHTHTIQSKHCIRIPCIRKWGAGFFCCIYVFWNIYIYKYIYMYIYIYMCKWKLRNWGTLEF